MVYLSQVNYLLFHASVELFTVCIAGAIFIFTINARKFMDRDRFILLLGMSYLFVGILDFLHTMVYKGMGVFSTDSADPATQLWISARYIESLSFLLCLVLAKRIPRLDRILLGYSLVTILVITAIITGWFPMCLEDGVGLTPFKIVSEYIIIGILLVTVVLLGRNREDMDFDTYNWLLLACIFTIASEFAFTLYRNDIYGTLNTMGHVIKAISFTFIYLGLVSAGLSRPYATMFRELVRKRDDLEVAVKDKDFLIKEVHHRVKNNLQIISGILDLQRGYDREKDLDCVVDVIQSRIHIISRLHERLYGSDSLDTIDVKAHLEGVIQDLYQSNISLCGKVTISVEVEGPTTSMDLSIPLTLLVHEMVTNSLKYAFEGRDGAITLTIRLLEDGTIDLLDYHDDGKGMEGEPKDGFGTVLIDAFSDQLGLVKHRDTTRSHGVRFTFTRKASE